MKRRDVDVFRPVGAVRPGRHADRRVAVLITGDLLAKVMTEVQPMKMAPAEAL